jgi:protocatechuate 3,4-dioxygenase beta subunit
MTEEGLTAEVVRRLEATPDPRLREIMQAAVKHLHAFAKEVRLTNEEWWAGIQFLTATGQKCDDVRQEFILLSDTLGFSSLLDIINNSHVEDMVTENTILGPFYVPNSPERAFGESMVEYDCGGEPSIVRGRVLDTEGHPIEGAVLDVWQNAANMFYAVQQPDVQPATNLRGIYRTGADGKFDIRGVRPTDYPIPADGPVGGLLKATGRHEWRAAHVHVKVSADGYESLTTHVFDRTSKYMDSDTVFGVKESLFGDFEPGIVEGFLVCDFDFVLARA